MAEVKNIKDLAQTDAITVGDYILIETSAGTNLIDFENFIIDEDNTTFAADLQADVITLTTTVGAVTADVDVTASGSALNVVNNTLSANHSMLQDELYGTDRLPEGSTVYYSALTGEVSVTNPEHLYRAESGGSKLAQYRGSPSKIYNMDGEIGSTLQALSAKVLEEAFTFVKVLSSEIFGNTHLAETEQGEQLSFTNGSSYDDWTPEVNPGGIIKAMIDGLGSVNVYIKTSSKDFVANGEGGQQVFEFTGLKDYYVDAASVSFSQQFPTTAANPGTGPYDPTGLNNIVVTNYSSDAVNGIYKWTVQLLGGNTPTADDFVTVNARIVAETLF
jgi:hypothetical protein